MTKKTNFIQGPFIIGCAVMLLCLLVIACNQDSKNTATASKPSGFVLNAAYTYDPINPVDFPKLDIPGFVFPRDSNTINAWIDKGDMKSQYAHAWGIWTGVTSYTDEQVGAEKLRVFETWLTPGEIIELTNSNDKKQLADGSIFRSNRANLNVPRQFDHAGTANLKGTIGDTAIIQDFETVAYSPAAAQFAYDNKIFSAVQLAKLQMKGNTTIPSFPNNTITTKPLYKILNMEPGRTTYSIAVWPPNPSTGYPNTYQGYPEKVWKDSVQIDITEKTRNPKTGVFGLSDFMYYKLNQEDVDYFRKKATEGTGVDPDIVENTKAGDIAILVAMHVTSREIENWTWQTFWWVPDADNPISPSSKAIADARPAQLTGAARHYAMSIAYYMVNPNEPYATNEKVIGKPNYGYNPYLEARFNVPRLDTTMSKIYTADGKTIPTGIGIRTNCMSCHRMSYFDMNESKLKFPFVGNAYVSQTNPIFKGKLLLDFAWSIKGNLDTTGLGNFLTQNASK